MNSIMSDTVVQKINPWLIGCFRPHDFVSGFVARHFINIKKAILVVAYLSLLGIFFLSLERIMVVSLSTFFS